jgi:hypothetical protein
MLTASAFFTLCATAFVWRSRIGHMPQPLALALIAVAATVEKPSLDLRCRLGYANPNKSLS